MELGLAAEAADGLRAELGDALEVLLAVRVRGDAGHLHELLQQVLVGGALAARERLQVRTLQRHRDLPAQLLSSPTRRQGGGTMGA